MQSPRQDDVHCQNWSETISFTVRGKISPRSEEEVVDLVRYARQEGLTVRPIGSGHSSTPVMVTEDLLVSFENMSGVTATDTDKCLATVLPGTGLEDLGKELEDAGLALENYGDVNYQTIAGAIGTGTHGTGERLRNVSADLVGGRLVTGNGEVVPFGLDAGEATDSELTRAAQVSLGTLGIFTSLTLQVRPAYDLHRRNYITHIDWALENFDRLTSRYRLVDFYWYPRSDLAQIRVLDEPGNLDDLDIPGELKTETRGPSHQIIPNDRQLKFDEIEYMLPREVGLDVFRKVRERVKRKHRKHVAWRVLVRTIAPDSAMLSNARERDTLTIALLHNAALEHDEYFRDMEPLFLEAGGRPHWGKKHTRTAAHLREMYPEWDRFQEIRRELDPDGIFLNDYLRTLLGEDDR
ncbi:MAG: D-arabinono-1,4-lactone oxidase [Corynebacterium sp.]|uniref:D-arabinono-1,4-lactone oxidase n=1 Tax=Corynebacterium sp. TaxID=1720 RepID=UPI0026E094B1|nr:D-arabinono-1,4-lactone oxidase [Corynebacterium sp.]MDO5670224.1 D-arabinono-1,4-lactone oxidase [Corynebacterium sp.]